MNWLWKRLWPVALGVGVVTAIVVLPEYFPDHGSMREAILKSDAAALRRHLDRGGDPNSNRAILYRIRFMFTSGTSPGGTRVDFGVQNPLVIIAIQQHEFESAKILLERGADPNARDDRGYTPLCDAALTDEPSLVKLLLARGADAKLIMPDGSTALREGPEFQKRIRATNPEIIAMLNEAGLR